MRAGESLRRALQKRQRILQIQQRLTARKPNASQAFMRLLGRAQALFPGAALIKKLLVIRLIAVETKIAITVTLKRCAKSF